MLLIDDLTVDCLTHKYVDDTTLIELLPRGSQQTHMQTQQFTWATPNKMKMVNLPIIENCGVDTPQKKLKIHNYKPASV